MSNNVNFELALRNKVRFTTSCGVIGTEDLWDLPLVSKAANRASLDDIAKGLNKQLKESGNEESFVLKTTKVNEELQLKFDIVKYIIEVKMKEASEKETAAAKADKKRQIRDLIAQKRTEEMGNKSAEELEKMLEELSN